MSVNPNIDLATAEETLTPVEKSVLDEVLSANRDRPGATMLVLTLVQEKIGYISPPMQVYIARELGVPLSHIYGVLTFYSSFRMSPLGRHKISICLGTACYVRGGPMLIEKYQQILGVKVGETTEDQRFTLEICRCVGACSQAPVVMIDTDINGRANPADVSKTLRKYE